MNVNVSIPGAIEDLPRRRRRSRTGNHASLQGGLVPRLRKALLFQDLLQVIVDQRLGAVGYGGSQMLQAGRHGSCAASAGARGGGRGRRVEVLAGRFYRARHGELRYGGLRGHRGAGDGE